jgi:hypothetical protein
LHELFEAFVIPLSQLGGPVEGDAERTGASVVDVEQTTRALSMPSASPSDGPGLGPVGVVLVHATVAVLVADRLGRDVGAAMEEVVGLRRDGATWGLVLALHDLGPRRVRQDLSSWLADRIQSAGHVPTHQMTVALGTNQHAGKGPDFIRRWNEARKESVSALASRVTNRVRRDIFRRRESEGPPLVLSVPERLKADRVTETPWHLHIIWFFEEDRRKRWEESKSLVIRSVASTCMDMGLQSAVQTTTANSKFVRYATKNIHSDLDMFYSNISEICTK